MCIIAFNVQKLTREGEVNFNQLWFSSIWGMYWFAGDYSPFRITSMSRPTLYIIALREGLRGHARFRNGAVSGEIEQEDFAELQTSFTSAQRRAHDQVERSGSKLCP